MSFDVKRHGVRLVLLAVVLVLLVTWIAYAIDVMPDSLDSGCTYSSGECGDPAPGNFPAAPGN